MKKSNVWSTFSACIGSFILFIFVVTAYQSAENWKDVVDEVDLLEPLV